MVTYSCQSPTDTETVTSITWNWELFPSHTRWSYLNRSRPSSSHDHNPS